MINNVEAVALRRGRHSVTRALRRRAVTLRLGAGLTGVALALAACGSSASTPDEQPAATSSANFVPSTGAEIPQVNLKFGMKPFPDSTFYSIAIKRGYFKDVGINVTPAPYGTSVTPDNVVQLLKNGDVDIVTINGPSTVKFMSQVPDLRMFGFADTYEATYLLASPDSGVESAAERIKAGVDPAKAIHDAMAAIKGRNVAFNNTGSQRVFLNTVFADGGLTFKDVNLTVTDDAKMVQLALGGKIDFATPDGAGQNVQLLRQGWYPLVSVTDLAKVPGNEQVVSASLSNEGPAAMSGFLEKNPELALRFLSVMFRSIDEIGKDPDSALADQLPYLTSRSGTDIGVEGLKQIYGVIDPLSTFEDQPQFWGPKVDSRNADTVYNAQVKAAQDGGILPKDKPFDVDTYMPGAQYYKILLDLKSKYDALLPQAAGLTGANAALAKSAAQQYQWRNYLDAYRMLRQATGT